MITRDFIVTKILDIEKSDFVKDASKNAFTNDTKLKEVIEKLKLDWKANYGMSYEEMKADLNPNFKRNIKRLLSNKGSDSFAIFKEKTKRISQNVLDMSGSFIAIFIEVSSDFIL